MQTTVFSALICALTALFLFIVNLGEDFRPQRFFVELLLALPFALLLLANHHSFKRSSRI